MTNDNSVYYDNNPAYYVVMDEHTLGYMCGSQHNMGVLAANELRGAPFEIWPGTKHVQFSNIRPATLADFKCYRVKPPPNFNDIENAARQNLG